MAIENCSEQLSKSSDTNPADVRTKLHELKNGVADKSGEVIASRGELIHNENQLRSKVESSETLDRLDGEKKEADHLISDYEKAELDTSKITNVVVAKIEKERERRERLNQLAQSLGAQTEGHSNALKKIQSSG